MSDTHVSWHRASIALGARTAVPLAFAAFPFGLVYGVAVSTSTVSSVVGVAASWIILAGAAQLSVLSLIDDGAAAAVVIGTALVINARFALYSAALAPAFREFPARWRLTLPYLLTDQAAAMALQHAESDDDPVRRRSFFVGAALLFVSGWWIGTIVGVTAAGSIPEDLDVGFAVPAMFIALLVPAVSDRPSLVAAVAAAAVTVAGASLPSGTNIVAAAVCGIAAGRAVAVRRRIAP